MGNMSAENKGIARYAPTPEEYSQVPRDSEAYRLGQQAVSYVWAAQDITRRGADDTGWADEFGKAYAVYAHEYSTGKRNHRRTIQDAFIAYSFFGHIDHA